MTEAQTRQIPLTARRMQADDLALVAAIESQVQRFPWRKQQFQDALDAGYQAWVWLAPPHTLIGHAILMPVLDEIELLSLAIAQDWQGQGLGRRCLNWLMSEARQSGMQSMLLEVAAGNTAALNLYQGAGFTRIGERRAYYRSANGQQDDAWVMRCELGHGATSTGQVKVAPIGHEANLIDTASTPVPSKLNEGLHVIH